MIYSRFFYSVILLVVCMPTFGCKDTQDINCGLSEVQLVNAPVLVKDIAFEDVNFKNAMLKRGIEKVAEVKRLDFYDVY